MSYNAAKSASDEPESFGRGNPAGVASAECGNNADNAASMIPALTLGIPGNVVAALVLGALLIHGLQPGPQLFHQNPGLVGGFMLQMLLTSLLILAAGGAAATRIFAQVQRACQQTALIRHHATSVLSRWIWSQRDRPPG